MGHQMHRYRTVAQQLPIQRREKYPFQGRFFLRILDDQRQRHLIDELHNLLVGVLDPHHFAGDLDAEFTHRPGLLRQPLPMGLQVAFKGLADLLGGKEAGHRQGLDIIKRHNVQGQLQGMRQCSSPVECRCTGHGLGSNQQ
ncbi:hypothetical protein D3C87_1506010 [compost metagenome]